MPASSSKRGIVNDIERQKNLHSSNTRYANINIVLCPLNIESPQYCCCPLIESPIPVNTQKDRCNTSKNDDDFLGEQ